MIERRAVVLGLLGGATGCATPTVDSCDPRRGGAIDYFRCRDQYDAREQMAHGRIASQEARLARATAENTRLRQEIVRIEQTLARTRANIARLQALEATLNAPRARTADRTVIAGYVRDLERFFAQFDAATSEALAFTPPPELSQRGARALQDRFVANRAALELRQAEARTDRRELQRVWGDFVGGYVTGEVLMALLTRLFSRYGLAALNPLLTFASNLEDLFSLMQAVAETLRILGD